MRLRDGKVNKSVTIILLKTNFKSKTTSFITNKTPVNNLSNYLYLLVSVFCQEPLFYDRYIAWFRIDDSFTDMLVRETGCTGT